MQSRKNKMGKMGNLPMLPKLIQIYRHPSILVVKWKMENCPVLSKTIQIFWYRSILSNLTPSANSQNYEKYAYFEDDVLLSTKPDDIYEWMANKFYGTPTPTAYNNPKKGGHTHSLITRRQYRILCLIKCLDSTWN